MEQKEIINSPEQKGLSPEGKEEIGKIALDASLNIKDADIDSWRKERAEKREEEAKKELRYWCTDYRETEHAFTKRDIGKNLREYEKWEDAAAEAFHKIERAEEDAGFNSRYERDAAERLATVDGRDSIEAYAGNFYTERNRSLINAIRSSNNEEADEDVDIIGGLHELVANYIRSTKDQELRRTNTEEYTANRREKHNLVIRRINSINQIAEKYGAKRFTFRDFETNDFAYKKELDPTKETDARVEYDRAAVESYIRMAFSDEFREAESGNGDEYYNPDESIVRQFHEG